MRHGDDTGSPSADQILSRVESSAVLQSDGVGVGVGALVMIINHVQTPPTPHPESMPGRKIRFRLKGDSRLP
jgi:hypothetical protein